MTSIRRYLTIALTAGVGVLLGITGWLVLASARRALTYQFDAALATKAQAIIAAAEADDGTIELELDIHRLTGFRPDHGRDAFEIRLADGTIVEQSPALAGARLPAAPASAVREPVFHELVLADGSAARAVLQRFDPDDDERGAFRDALLIVASPSGGLARTLDVLAWILLGAGLIALCSTVPLVRAVLRRGLAPVAKLATRTAEIGAATLDQRLDVDGLPVELRPIATELNRLVARLQQSFERERRFSSDVAHELRTPLAELHTVAELACQWPEHATPEAFADVLAITRDMDAMIAKLRQLAYMDSDSGMHGVDRQAVDLRPSIEAAWARLREQADARGVRLEPEIADQVIQADPVLWRSILGNLLGNAVAYSPPGSAVRVEADRGRVAIRNPAGELAAEDLPQLFDRFWRKDAARSGYGHAGLGLALVRGFCALHGWQVRAILTPAAELEICIELGPRQG